MVAKSALVDVRPFQLGLAVALTGLLLTLGTAHGGLVGDGLESLVALGLGTTGATILGVLLTVAGTLFLTGASLGAILRRTGHELHRAHTARAARARRRASRPCRSSRREHVLEPPVDVRKDYPDLVSDSVSRAAAGPLRAGAEERRTTSSEEHTQETLVREPDARRGLQAPRPRAPEAVEARQRPDGRGERRASPRRSSRASRTSVSTRR